MAGRRLPTSGTPKWQEQTGGYRGDGKTIECAGCGRTRPFGIRCICEKREP